MKQITSSFLFSGIAEVIYQRRDDNTVIIVYHEQKTN